MHPITSDPHRRVAEVARVGGRISCATSSTLPTSARQFSPRDFELSFGGGELPAVDLGGGLQRPRPHRPRRPRRGGRGDHHRLQGAHARRRPPRSGSRRGCSRPASTPARSSGSRLRGGRASSAPSTSRSGPTTTSSGLAASSRRTRIPARAGPIASTPQERDAILDAILARSREVVDGDSLRAARGAARALQLERQRLRVPVDLPVRGVKVESGPHGPLTAEQTEAVERARRARCSSPRTPARARRSCSSSASCATWSRARTTSIRSAARRSSRSRSRARRPASCARGSASASTQLGARVTRARSSARGSSRSTASACACCARTPCSRASIPSFGVLDDSEARELAGLAFADALEDWLGPPEKPRAGALRLLAAYGYDELYEAIRQIHESLRNAGQRVTRGSRAAHPGDRGRGARAARAGGVGGARGAEHVGRLGQARGEALERLAECLESLAGAGEPQPSRVRSWRPAQQGAALTTETIEQFRQAICDYARRARGRARRAAARTRGRAARGLRRGVRASARRARTRSTSPTSRCARARCCAGSPAVAAGYRARLRRVMVDEFQDTNALQVSLIEALGVDGRVHGRRRAPVHLRLPPRRRRGLHRASTRPAARPARARRWPRTSARAARSSSSSTRRSAARTRASRGRR